MPLFDARAYSELPCSASTFPMHNKSIQPLFLNPAADSLNNRLL